MAQVRYEVVAPPDAEPVRLEEVKTHLRLIPNDDTEDEDILRPLITTAREYCENVTGRALAVQTLAAYPAANQRAVTLPRPPLLEVVGVTAHLADGTETELDATAYAVDRLAGVVWLQTLPDGLRAIHPVQITYRAGYEKLPATLRQAILLLVGHWYENREAVEVGAIASVEVGHSVRALIHQYKVWWF